MFRETAMRTRTIVLSLILMIMICTVSASVAEEIADYRHAANNLPGVEPEMMEPGYWISLMDDPDDIVMTPEQILAFNARVRTKTVAFPERFGKPDPLESGFGENLLKGLIMNYLEPLELPSTIPGDSLRTWIDYNIDFLNSRDFYDDRNATWPDYLKEELVAKMNRDTIPDTIRRRYGIIVRHSNIRYLPTLRPGYSNLEWALDFFQATGVCIGDQVAVLHQSTDGDFYFVQTHIARGWIDARNIALGPKDMIRNIAESEKFLMATEDKVPVYGDAGHKNFSRHLYYSGSMPLVGSYKNGYVVKMPYRGEDGSLEVVNAFVKEDADVYIGYLPYTKRNVITQLFKLLNKPYGWGDQDNKRSCAGTMRVLFRCFGLKMGRYPSFELSASDKQVFIDPDLSMEEKLAEVAKIEPFVTIAGSPFHVVLYIGKGKNGKQYFMHQAGWGYDEGSTHFYVNRTTINELTHVFYDVGRPRVFTTLR